MKRNLLLLLSLIALLTMTYFVFEVGERESKILKTSKTQIFNPQALGEMESFSNSVVEIAKEGESYYTVGPKVLVSQLKIEAVFEILSKIRSTREIQEDELNPESLKSMFPHEKYKMEFSFKNGVLKFIFGEKLQFSEDFYLKVTWVPKTGEAERKMVIAKDTSLKKGMYQKADHHRSGQKYLRLLNIVYLDADFFYETRVFPGFKREDFESFSVVSKTHRPFSVNLTNTKTTPPPFHEDLRYEKDFFNSIQSELINLKAQRVVPTSLVGESQSPELNIILNFKDSSQAEVSLYQSREVKGEYLLKKKGQDITYLFEQRPSVLFTNLQQFWQRRPLLDFAEGYKLSLEGSDKQHSFEIFEGDSDLKMSLAKKMRDFLLSPADLVDSEDAWSDIQGKTMVEIHPNANSEKVFYVQEVNNELQLRDSNRGLVYRYISRPPAFFKQLRDFMKGES